ncbi:hypothetical protein [Promicromonospora soli]|uniref:Uncharacterized protein n=1 Tax=Promicromonospora soli TaxID=2035533 RepID=A0A919FPC0_9MICO|nr:hypothetical protein [Promicromonospora soli]GHH69524.1 hypothetical protein GCM10017772_14620 [Promicromonospora soli]
MTADLRTSGVAGASVPAPSAGDVLRFAAYVAELIGDDRVGDVSWHADKPQLYVEVFDTAHGETVAHLLGLDPRSDHGPGHRPEGFSCWTGKSGLVPVFLRAPLALGGMPHRRPYRWSEDTADDAQAVA